MTFWPSGDTSQSINACPNSFFTFGCSAGFTSMALYWLNMRRSPSTKICRSPLRLKEIQVQVGECVAINFARHIECRFHALVNRFVPRPLFFLNIDTGILVPEREFGEMGARAVAAR